MLLLIQESKSRRFLTKFGLIPSNVFFRLGSAQSKLGVHWKGRYQVFLVSHTTFWGNFMLLFIKILPGEKNLWMTRSIEAKWVLIEGPGSLIQTFWKFWVLIRSVFGSCMLCHTNWYPKKVFSLGKHICLKLLLFFSWSLRKFEPWVRDGHNMSTHHPLQAHCVLIQLLPYLCIIMSLFSLDF